MSKQIINYSAVCVTSVILTLALHSLYLNTKPPEKEVVYYPYYTTVYHLQAPSAWKLISANAATDTAYYIADEDQMWFEMPKLNDEVTFYSGFTGVINDITVTGFSVKITRGEVRYGMSGMPVYDSNNDVIGYISAASSQNELYCIWR